MEDNSLSFTAKPSTCACEVCTQNKGVFLIRKYMYVQNPKVYEVFCDKCDGSNVEWSEFDGHIWCYDCKVDTRGTEGVFGGPIPVHGAALMGLSFDLVNIKTHEVIKFEDDEAWEKAKRGKA